MTSPARRSGWLARLVALFMITALLVVDTSWAREADDDPPVARSAG